MKRITEIKIDNTIYIIYKVNNRLIVKYHNNILNSSITEYYKIIPSENVLIFKAIKLDDYTYKNIKYPYIIFSFDKIEIFSKVVNNVKYGLTL